SVEEGSPAHEAGLGAGDLITHINGESVLGLVHTDVLGLLLKSGNKVVLCSTPLENTSIKIGPARKMSFKGKMARCSKRARKKEAQERKRSHLQKISKQSRAIQTSKSFSSALHQSLSSGESVPGSPTLSPSPTIPCQNPAPQLQSGPNSPPRTSPGPSAPSSPAGNVRPCTLHGLAAKPNNQRYKSGRRKSINSIPPSPLAITSSPTAQISSPHRSPSPLTAYSKNIQTYPSKMLSPPATVRHSIRVRPADSPRSPLLKRVQSAEKLSAAYLADKKQCSSGRDMQTPPGEGMNETLPKECQNLGEIQTLAGRQGPGENVQLVHVGTQRLREQTTERHERDQDIVVMKKLHWSERCDSFKKQEAVQEVSFDEAVEWDRTKREGAGGDRGGAGAIEEKCSEHKAAWVKERFDFDTSTEDSNLKEPKSLKSASQIETQTSEVESHKWGGVEWECHVTNPSQGLCQDSIGQLSTGDAEINSLRKQQEAIVRPKGQVLPAEIEAVASLSVVHCPHLAESLCCQVKTQSSLTTDESLTQIGQILDTCEPEAVTDSREDVTRTDSKLNSQPEKQEAGNTITSNSPAKKSTRNRRKGRVKD
ncbi:microtubule-associated serine/threonine-protein kinase 3-like, partial [Mustelus asterias]